MVLYVLPLTGPVGGALLSFCLAAPYPVTPAPAPASLGDPGVCYLLVPCNPYQPGPSRPEDSDSPPQSSGIGADPDRWVGFIELNCRRLITEIRIERARMDPDRLAHRPALTPARSGAAAP